MLMTKRHKHKSFYAYVKSKSRGTSKVGPLQDAQGRLVEDCIGVGRLLNEFKGYLDHYLRDNRGFK